VDQVLKLVAMDLVETDRYLKMAGKRRQPAPYVDGSRAAPTQAALTWSTGAVV
jgi:hypothetical protein